MLCGCVAATSNSFSGADVAKHEARVELFYDGTWNDHTSSARALNAIRISRGRGDEQSEPTPSSCTLTLDNRDGTFNPRNPSSSLFGKIGRNTPLRVSVGPMSVLDLPGGSGNYVSSPDHASLDIVGDIDIRARIAPDDWTPSADQAIVSKSHTTGNQRSYQLVLQSPGNLRFTWSTDGTGTGATNADSTTSTGFTNATAHWVRVTLATATGTVTFYTSDDGETWTQLGAAVVVGATSIFAGTATANIGARSAGTADLFAGLIYRAEIRNGINGTVVADPRFDQQAAGATSFADSTGKTWTLNGTAAIVAVPGGIRFVGEVASWQPQRAVKGDAWTLVTANGILRRLGQGAKPLRSALWREILFNDAVASWPMGDGADASTAASMLPGGEPMSIRSYDWTSGLNVPLDWDPVSYADWVEPIATPAENVVLTTQGTIPMDPNATSWAGEFVFVVDPDADPNAAVLCVWQGNTGPTRVEWIFGFFNDTWELSRRTRVDGALSGPDTLVSSGTVSVDVGAPYNDGRIHHARLTTERVGADVDWRIYLDDFELDFDTLVGSDWSPLGGVNCQLGTPTGRTAIGFVTAWDSFIIPLFLDVADAALTGRSGERAAERLARLCDEEGIEFTLSGSEFQTEAMGPQRLDTLLANLRDCEEADLGILFETRNQLGLAYRTRRDLYNQTPVLELDFDAFEVAPPLEPVVDDFAVRNDITVNRPNGSSARAVKTSGPLNVNDPDGDPDGVGLYDVSVDANVEADAQLEPLAYWRLNVGTVDEIRYPRVTVDLDATPALTAASSSVDVGDAIVMDNPPDSPDAASLLAFGYDETIGTHRRLITFNAVPADPYDVGIYDDGTGTVGNARYDTPYATTAGQITTGTSTTLSVATETSRALWVTGSSSPQFPLDINLAGARVRVTQISGASSPQTFTISTTVVNGVTKVIPAGTPVRIWDAKRYGL